MTLAGRALPAISKQAFDTLTATFPPFRNDKELRTRVDEALIDIGRQEVIELIRRSVGSQTADELVHSTPSR